MTVSGEGTAGKAESSDFSTDKTNNSFTVSLAAGATTGSGTFTLTIADDNVVDVVSETITVSGTTDRSGLAVTGDTITIDSDNDNRPHHHQSGGGHFHRHGNTDGGNRGGGRPPDNGYSRLPDGSNVYEKVIAVTLSATGVTASAGDFTFAATSLANPSLILNIPSSQASVSDSSGFLLTAVDDNTVEPAETLTIGGTATGFTVSGVTATIDDNDPAPTTIDLSVDTDSGTVGDQTNVMEGGSATTVTVKATLAGSSVLTSDTVVTVSVAGEGTTGKAEAADFTAVTSFDVTISAGQSSGAGTFTLTLTDDDLAEGNESLTVSGVTTASGFSTVNSASVNIVDNDVTPTTITLTINPTSVSEGGGATTVDVTAAFPAGSPTFETATSVSVSVSGGTATSGTDYAAVTSFTVSIAAGETSGMGTFTFTPTEDTVAGEGNETINVSGTAAGFTFTNAVLSIADNDVKPSSIVLTVDADGDTTGDQTSVTEASGSTTVSVKVAFPANSPSLASATDVTVKLVGEPARSGEADETTLVLGQAKGKVMHTTGFDYSTNKTNDTFTITIPAGQTSQTGDFTLTVVDDTQSEGPETFKVAGTSTGFTFNAAPEMTITDNETTDISLFFSDGDGNRRPADSPFDDAEHLKEGVHEDTTLPLWGGVAPPTLPFNIYLTLGTAVGQQYLDITIRTSGTAVEGILTDTSRDYDLQWRHGPSTVFSREALPNNVFRIGRGHTRYNEGGEELSPTQSIFVYDDNIAEGDETITFTGHSIQGVSNSISVTLKDNDIAPTVINLAVDTDTSTPATSETKLMEGDSSTTVKITASFPVGSAVLPTPTAVAVSLMDNTATSRDHLAVPSFNVIIPALATSGSTEFTLTLVDDDIVEDPEILDVGGTLAGFTVNPAMITIADNETISLSLDTDGATTGAQTSVDEGVTDQTVTVTASFDAASSVLTGATVVTVSAADGSTNPASAPDDYTAVSDFTITIPAGDISASATFDLTTAADNIALEGSETLSVSGTATGYTVTNTTMSITDGTTVPSLAFTVDADTSTPGVQTSVGEGVSGRSVEVTASLSGSNVLARDLTIPVTVGRGTAETTDYSVTGGSFNLTISAGQSTSNTETFTLNTVDDSVTGETDALSVGGTATLAGVTFSGSTPLTINDDDAATVGLSVDTDSGETGDQTSLEEGVSGRSVTVTATVSGSLTVEAATTVAVTVGAGTAESSDYSIPSGQESFDVVIAAGTGSDSETFALTTKTDTVVGEADVLAVSGATAGFTVSGASLTITETGTIGLSVDADGGTSGDQTSLAEGISGRTVTVTATVAGGGTVEAETTVAVTVGAGTAEATDYSIPSGEDTFDVTIAAGASSGSATFTLTTKDDSVVAETDVLSVTGTTTAAGITVSSASLTIDDTDTGTVTLSVDADGSTSGDQTSIDEGVSGRSVTVKAKVGGSLTVEADTTVAVTVGAGTAEASDYSIPSGQETFGVVISAGGSLGSNTFTLTTNPDSVAGESDLLSITGSTTAAGLTVSSASLQIGETVTIGLSVDTDGNTPGAQASLAEGVSSRTVTVTAAVAGGGTMEAETSVSVSVGAGTAEGSDYSIPSGQESFMVTISAGASSGSATFSLTTNNDSVISEVDVLAVSGTAAGFTVSGASLAITGTGTIGLSVDADGGTSGDQTSLGEGVSGRTVTVTAATATGVTVEADTTVAVTVGAGTAEATDYSIPSGQDTFDVVIAAGGSSGSNTFTLTTRDDTVVAETDVLSVTGTTTAAGVTVSSASLTIDDSDTGTVGLSVSPASLAEGLSNQTVTVTATVGGSLRVEAETTVAVSVGAGTAEGSDYSIPSGQESFDVVIAAGGSSGSNTFTLTTNSDSVISEVDALAISGSVSGFTVNGASLTITETGTIGLSVDADSASGAQTTIGEGVSGRTVTVTATVAGGGTAETETTVAVTVGAGTAESSDYSIPSGEETFDVTIAAGASSGSSTFTLNTVDDDVVNEADALEITGSTTTTGITVNKTSLTISDDDTAVIDLSVSPASLSEGEANRSVSVTATLAGSLKVEAAITVAVTVGAGTAEASDYSIPSGQDSFDVTIAAGTGSKSGSFTLSTVDDSVAGESDVLAIGGVSGSLTVNGASLTINDGDSAPAIGLSVSPASLGEGVANRSVTVTATLAGSTTMETDTTVAVTVGAGTAEASDYSIPAGQETFDVTISAGSPSGSNTFTLTTKSDSVISEVDALAISGSVSGFTVNGASLAITDTGTIGLSMDADGGTSGAQTSVGEDVSGRTVTVTAAVSGGGTVEAETTVAVSVGAGTAEASDYSITAGEETFNVVIAAGTGSKSGTFTLNTVDDDVVGEADALAITGSTTTAGVSVGSASLTISDDDAAVIDLSVDADSGTPEDQTSIEEGVTGRSVSVTATVAGSLTVEAETTVSVSVGAGTAEVGDYSIPSGQEAFTVEIAAGTGVKSGTFALTTNSDSQAGEADALSITGTASGFTVNGASLQIGETVNIGLSVDADGGTAGDQASLGEGVSSRTVTVTAATAGGVMMETETTVSVTVGAGTAEVGDYSIPSGQETFDVTIAAGSSSGSGTFTLTTNSDSVISEVDALAVSGSAAGFTVGGASLTITDTGTIGLSVSPTSLGEGCVESVGVGYGGGGRRGDGGDGDDGERHGGCGHGGGFGLFDSVRSGVIQCGYRGGYGLQVGDVRFEHGG